MHNTKYHYLSDEEFLTYVPMEQHIYSRIESLINTKQIYHHTLDEHDFYQQHNELDLAYLAIQELEDILIHTQSIINDIDNLNELNDKLKTVLKWRDKF